MSRCLAVQGKTEADREHTEVGTFSGSREREGNGSPLDLVFLQEPVSDISNLFGLFGFFGLSGGGFLGASFFFDEAEVL